MESSRASRSSVKVSLYFAKTLSSRLRVRVRQDFAVVPVTPHRLCRRLQHSGVSGDIVYLAPDGLRTIAGTERIGDVELGTVSRRSATRQHRYGCISSLVIKGTQYRLFFPDDSGTHQQPGIIGTIKAGKAGVSAGSTPTEGHQTRMLCVRIYSGTETVLHGGYDGYIYKQESGNTFDGTKYRPSTALGHDG